MRQKFLCIVGLAMALLAMSSAAARAQTVAVGPYYATPSWDQTFTCTTAAACTRFVVLANFNSEAVLDRETGLVWQRTPVFESNTFQALADLICKANAVGGRYGWRLPTLPELMTLADPTNSAVGAAHLPPGHPFLGTASTGAGLFWSIDLLQSGSSGQLVDFQNNGPMGTQPGASVDSTNPSSFSGQAWCVRAENSIISR